MIITLISLGRFSSRLREPGEALLIIRQSTKDGKIASYDLSLLLPISMTSRVGNDSPMNLAILLNNTSGVNMNIFQCDRVERYS